MGGKATIDSVHLALGILKLSFITCFHDEEIPLIQKTAIAAFRQALAGADDPNILPKNRAEKTARYCRFKNPVWALIHKNIPVKKISSGAWTPFPLQPENGIARLPIRAFYGVF